MRQRALHHFRGGSPSGRVGNAERFFEELTAGPIPGPRALRRLAPEDAGEGGLAEAEAEAADLFLAELTGEAIAPAAPRPKHGGGSRRGTVARRLEAVGSDPGCGPEDAAAVDSQLTAIPTPDRYYQIRRGDTLLGIAGRAYGVSAGSQRLQLARLINDHPFNLRLRDPKPVNLFPQGIVSFLPRFGAAEAQVAAGGGPVPSGSQFAVVFIPNRNPGELRVTIRTDGEDSTGTEDLVTEESPEVEMTIGQTLPLWATGSPLPVEVYEWTVADPIVAVVEKVSKPKDHPNELQVLGAKVGATTVTVIYKTGDGRETTDTIKVKVNAIQTPYGPSNPYRIDDLRRDEVPAGVDISKDDFYAFKKKVYVQTIRNGEAAHGKFVWGVPKSLQRKIEGKTLHMHVIEPGKAMLTAARKALQDAIDAGDEDAAKTKKIALSSAYRDADNQFGKWSARFEDYFKGHKDAMADKPGGMFGDAALKSLAKVIGKGTGAPGYSFHQHGAALDFAAPEAGVRNKLNDADQAKWRATWFYRWLEKNAATYGFEPYSAEAWHWNFTALK